MCYTNKNASECLMSVLLTKKNKNLCYGNNKATDQLIFKEFFVQGIVRIHVHQVSIDGTKITAHEENINTEVVMDTLN